MFGSGWFLDLPYRVVAIRQVLNTGDAHRARQHVCPAGSPGMAGGFTGVRSCDAAVLWWYSWINQIIISNLLLFFNKFSQRTSHF